MFAAVLCAAGEFDVASASPTVEFTHIPPTWSTDDLTGRVANADTTA
jgi:hypothetical protein